MTRIFKTAEFKRWADKEQFSDEDLIRAVDEMDRGLVDASLGGEVFKKRVARKGQGKRSGYRTLVAFRSGDRAFYLFGFAKNERENISKEEQSYLKKLAQTLFAMTDDELDIAIKNYVLYEIGH